MLNHNIPTAYLVPADTYEMLMEALNDLQVESARLGGFKDVYKIKLRSAGYRLAYQVRSGELVVIVLTAGKREKGAVYVKLRQRLQ